MENHTNGQYVICGGSDQYWVGTNAKTLAFAKTAASKKYQPMVGMKIEVAQVFDNQYVRVAVKYGYDKWTQA